ncbi:hypothetical protein CVT24_007522 [Panaeolus cyanescens]|uniref:Uncharacterized protein n=1 Tax=Panaeolus cyanescens TaxID=181874 RepID=A0A409YWF4_9AGAR|nr:hypothetical protein CVT24_007522 [Panaeolus cyanescens]
MGKGKLPVTEEIPPTIAMPSHQPVVRRLPDDNVPTLLHPYIRRVSETVFHLDERAIRKPKNPNQVNIRVVTAASIGQFIEYDTAIRKAPNHRREVGNKPLGYDSFARIFNDGYDSWFYQMAVWDPFNDTYEVGGRGPTVDVMLITDAQRGLVNADTVNQLKDMAADSALQRHRQQQHWSGNSTFKTYHPRRDGVPFMRRGGNPPPPPPPPGASISMSSRDRAFIKLRQVEQQEAKKKELQLRIQPSTPPNHHQQSRKRQVPESPTESLVRAREAKAKSSGRVMPKSPGVKEREAKKVRRGRKGGLVAVGAIDLVVEDKGEGSSGSSGSGGEVVASDGEGYDERLDALMLEEDGEAVPTGSKWTVDEDDKMQD